VILAEELESSMHPPDGRYLSAELDMTQVHVDRINSECITKAKRLP
jgi:hypothetical protein